MALRSALRVAFCQPTFSAIQLLLRPTASLAALTIGSLIKLFLSVGHSDQILQLADPQLNLADYNP
jgi:hypothetical protein